MRLQALHSINFVASLESLIFLKILVIIHLILKLKQICLFFSNFSPKCHQIRSHKPAQNEHCSPEDTEMKVDPDGEQDSVWLTTISRLPSREHVQHERRLVAFVYEYGFRICLRLCQVAPRTTICHDDVVVMVRAAGNLLHRGVRVASESSKG